jgi:hypothetical protein
MLFSLSLGNKIVPDHEALALYLNKVEEIHNYKIPPKQKEAIFSFCKSNMFWQYDIVPNGRKFDFWRMEDLFKTPKSKIEFTSIYSPEVEKIKKEQTEKLQTKFPPNTEVLFLIRQDKSIYGDGLNKWWNIIPRTSMEENMGFTREACFSNFSAWRGLCRILIRYFKLK